MDKNYLYKEGETPKDFAERLQKELDDYTEKLSKISEKEALDEEEKKCVDELVKYEDYLKQTEYDLQESVTFDGTAYTRNEIASSIMYFLNKMEVKWDFTLGLYEMYKLWKNQVEKLTFNQLDSTLRTLDQVQFKGQREWKDILAINEYFKSVNEQFSIDTAGMIYLHKMHNAVLDRMELVKPVNSMVEHYPEEVTDADANA